MPVTVRKGIYLKCQKNYFNKNFCRLDFLHTILANPAQDNPNQGTCRDEKFFVEGYPNIPQICGKNSGQHSKYYNTLEP